MGVGAVGGEERGGNNNGEYTVNAVYTQMHSSQSAYRYLFSRLENYKNLPSETFRATVAVC